MAIGETAKQLKKKQSDVSVIETARMTLHVLREIRVLIEKRVKLVNSGDIHEISRIPTTYSNTKVNVSLVCTMS